MAIDLDALRAKHAELTKQTSPEGDGFIKNFLQLNEGTNVVRVLPGKEDDSMFYAETKIHRVYEEDGAVHNYHCLKVHGDSCPLCDAYYGLWKTGSKDDETTARQIKPRARYYMNVVDRESGDVKILSVGIILFKKMIAAMLDEDFGDITDLQEGHDFKIIKQMEGQWPRYDQSAPRPKSSPTGSNSEVAAYMESLHDIYSLVRKEDYEEIKKVAENILPTSVRERKYEDNQETEDYLSKMQS